jgi:thiol:disulfide interchange protein DsbD
MSLMQQKHSLPAALIGSLLCAIATAQTPADLVQWSAAYAPTGNAKGEAVLEISGTIQEGWHVYALTQPSGGPAALHVTLDANDVAQISGAASGPAPLTHRDPGFGFETQFYTHSFTIRVPIALKQAPAPEGGVIPVRVRFQTCSDRVCLPPTTTQLSVPVATPRSGA